MFKKVMSKTIVFVAVMVFILGFKTIFGESNTLVGVTTLCLLLVTLGRDLTARPVKNLFSLIIINLLLGLGAFMVAQNLWLGMIINFVIMFLIAYYFSYELRKPLNMMVGLHYILMMTNPITTNELPMRVLALIAGPVLLMGVQLVANRNKVRKSCPVLLKQIEEDLLEKIKLSKGGESVSELNEKIIKNMNSVKMIVHDSTPNRTQLSRLSRTVIGVLSCLERLNLLLDLPCDMVLLDELEISLKEKKSFNLEPLEATLAKNHQVRVYELMTTMALYLQQQEVLSQILENKQIVDEKNEVMTDGFKEKSLINRPFNYCSIRFGYGVRLGFLVAITMFITDYFQLNYGVWLVYTVFALTQPFIEFTVAKAKKRLIGTTIGAIAIFILFMIIPDASLRVIILLAAGYLMSYMTDYRNIVIFVTICSICSAASGLDFAQSGIVVFSRVFFVVIGILISLMMNKCFMKSSYGDEEKGITTLKLNILKFMFDKIYVDEVGANKTIDYLYLIPPFIESRIEHWDLAISEDRVYKQRWLMNYLHQVHLQISLNPTSEKLMNQIKPLVQSETKESMIEKLNELMSETDDASEWQLCSTSLMLMQQMPIF